MSLAILFHFLCAQHVSDINISFIRSLRIFCWITTLVVLFLVRCVLEFRRGWVGVVSVLQAEAYSEVFVLQCTCLCRICSPQTQNIPEILTSNLPVGKSLLRYLNERLCVSYVYGTVHHLYSWVKRKPTWCQLFYYLFNTHSMLNMFRPLIRPSSGVCD